MKQILIDSLNGFSFKDLPLFLFHLASAVVLGLILGWIYKFKTNAEKKEILFFPILALGIALLAALIKISVAFAIAGLVAVLFLKPLTEKKSSEQQIYYFLLAVLAVGCGVGSVVLSVLGGGLIFLFLLLVPKAKS